MTISNLDNLSLEELMALAKELPPLTPAELALQKLDWVYGNLAASTNHKPARAAMKLVALYELDIAEDVFEKWAEKKEWTR